MAGGLGGVFGVSLRLSDSFNEDWVKTPFYDSELISQTVSALCFAGLWFASVRRERSA
jgi:hypothetical protein